MVAPRGQSRRDISTQHPPARAATGVNLRGVGFKARNAASTALRPRTVNVARRISAHVRSPARPLRALTCFAWSSQASGAPSTCNSARLGIREFVGMQRFWVGGRCQPRSVLRRSAERLLRKHGQPGSEGSDRSASRWRTQPSVRSCGAKLALEKLVVLERNSATRVERTGVVRAAHVRGGRRHSGEGQSPR